MIITYLFLFVVLPKIMSESAKLKTRMKAKDFDFSSDLPDKGNYLIIATGLVDPRIGGINGRPNYRKFNNISKRIWI